MLTLHQRRVANELDLLERSAALNPAILKLTGQVRNPESSLAHCELLASPAVILEDGAPVVVVSHRIEIRLPRFFPAVPIEIYLRCPVFHPNVDPESGFVCLWSQFSPDDTCFDAIQRLRWIMAWKMMNPNPLHIMQPEALRWFEDPGGKLRVPFELEELRSPEPERRFLPRGRSAGSRRKRLID